MIRCPPTAGAPAAEPEREQIAPRGLTLSGRARGADRRRRRRSDPNHARPSRSDARAAVPTDDRGTASAPTKILLATSGSAAGRNATAVAAELAKSLVAELTIVHVVPAIEYRVGRLAPTLTLTGRLHDADVNPVLRDARQVASSMGVPAQSVLIAGSAPRVIVALADRLGADLLVIGATRRRGLAHMPGRTGRWVQAHAPCPVLAVPDHLAREPTARPDRDLTAERVRTVLMQLLRRLLRLLQRASRPRGYRHPPIGADES